MAYMRIRCDYCGGAWEVYHRDNWNDKKARTCPHCQQAIDGQLWERQVLPAFGSVEDANSELYKGHVGYHSPLFQIDFIADTIFADRWRDKSNV